VTDGLVMELQRDAMDKNTSIADLLRKAIVVSAKLQVSEMRTAFERELQGYPVDVQVPTYRVLSVELRARSYGQGYQPIYFQDEASAGWLRKLDVRYEVAKIERMLADPQVAMISVPFSPEFERKLIEDMDLDDRPQRVISVAQIAAILDAIRNLVLFWALDLEQKGVLGEGLTFSRQDITRAATVTNNYYGNHIGSMNQSMLQQNSSGSQSLTVNADVGALIDLLTEIGSRLNDISLDSKCSQTLAADVRTALAQASSPEPKKTILQETLKSVRTTLEGAAGNVLASDFTQRLVALLPSLGLS